MGTNVVLLDVVREMKKLKKEDSAYETHILSLSKLDLLEEMIRFQEERSRLGFLTTSMMVRGQILFEALEKSAETEELRQLMRSYRKHLRYELEAAVLQA